MGAVRMQLTEEEELNRIIAEIEKLVLELAKKTEELKQELGADHANERH